MTDDQSPWMCHICHYCSTAEEGIACSACFKITCRAHLRTATDFNQQSGLYEITRICSLCQLRKIT